MATFLQVDTVNPVTTLKANNPALVLLDLQHNLLVGFDAGTNTSASVFVGLDSLKYVAVPWILPC